MSRRGAGWPESGGPNVTTHLQGTGTVDLGLTRGADYAVRAMLALAAHEGVEPVSSRRIAAEWGIPARFLVKVLGRLADRGLVRATIGRSGGYRLAWPAAEISLLDVVTAIEEPPTEARCVLRGGPCRPDGRCLVHDAFTAARVQFEAELRGRSLAAILGETGWRPPTLPNPDRTRGGVR